MNNEFHHIDLENLIAFYTKEAAELKTALLNGAQWNEVREKRILVTQLAIAIQKKYSTDNPAENPARHQDMAAENELTPEN